MSNIDLQHVVTGKVRLSFVHLFTPYAHQPGNEPKYSSTVLLPKSDIVTKQKLDAAMNAAIQDGVSSQWGGVRPPVLAFPVYDGDGVRPNGELFGDECKGHWVFTASSKQAPEIIDLNMNKILNQTEVYSGMYARVSVRFFAYNKAGKKGVGCGLGPVQKMEDGEPLGGRISAAAAFGDAPQGYAPGYTPAYPQQTQPQVQQPAYGQQPVQQPVQPAQPGQQVQLDPITGLPVVGPIMGL